MKFLASSLVVARLDRLATSFKGSHLWYGPSGIGKYAAVMVLARRLNCLSSGDDDCGLCRQIDSGNFPDVVTVAPTDKPSIGIEQIRLLSEMLGLKPYRAGATRLIIVNGADKLTPEAQNALLKVIEEPPPATGFILLAVDPLAVLVTIRSRCVELAFSQVAEAVIERALVDQLGVAGFMALTLSQLSGGRPGLAVALAHDPEALMRLQDEQIKAAALVTGPLFDQMMIIREFADAKADLVAFGQLVVTEVRRAAREAPPGQSCQQLVAAARYLERMRGGVTPRTAIEGLVIEL